MASQLGKLSIKDVPVALQMKLAKLLLFVQGPWLELYQASSDRAGVIQSFNDHAVAQFQGIWASTNRGQWFVTANVASHHNLTGIGGCGAWHHGISSTASWNVPGGLPTQVGVNLWC